MRADAVECTNAKTQTKNTIRQAETQSQPQPIDNCDNYSDKDFLLRRNAAQTTLAGVAQLAGARVIKKQVPARLAARCREGAEPVD